MRVKKPIGLTGKSLFSYLKENKETIIKQKCSLPIKSEPTAYTKTISVLDSISKEDTKTIKAITEETNGSDVLSITAIANTANWCDSQMDVLLPYCWDKTIKESGVKGKNRIYHLKNHEHLTDGIVGVITNIYHKDFTLSELGINKIGGTQCLVFDSNVKKEYDSKVYQLYKDKVISQHSIGLQYVKILLCINDEEDEEHYKNWKQYYSQVINKDTIDEEGYFWAVQEIKLLEISSVLWGANEISQTLYEDNKKSEDIIINQITEETGETPTQEAIEPSEQLTHVAESKSIEKDSKKECLFNYL